MKNSSLVLFSGGIDSTVSVLEELAAGRSVHLLTFRYPRQPRAEQTAVTRLYARLKKKFPRRVGTLFTGELPGLAAGGRPVCVPAKARTWLDFYGPAVSLAAVCGAAAVVASPAPSDGQNEKIFFSAYARIVRDCYSLELRLPLRKLDRGRGYWVFKRNVFRRGFGLENALGLRKGELLLDAYPSDGWAAIRRKTGAPAPGRRRPETL